MLDSFFSPYIRNITIRKDSRKTKKLIPSDLKSYMFNTVTFDNNLVKREDRIKEQQNITLNSINYTAKEFIHTDQSHQ